MRAPLAITSLLALAVPLAAQEVAVARGPRRQPLQELPQGDAVYPQERGELQLTLAGGARRARGLASSLSAELGLTDRLQLEVSLERTSNDARPDRAAFAYGVGVRRSWLDVAHTGTHLAVGLEASAVPHDGATPEVEPQLALARDLPGARGAQIFASGEGRSWGEASWTAGAFVPARGLVLVGQATRGGASDDEPASLDLTAGAVLALPLGLEASIGAPWRLRGADRGLGALLKLTAEF